MVTPLLVLAILLGHLPAFAAVEEPKAPTEGTTPPRLSLVEGDASFWRQGAPDWVPARLNTPLEPGDALYAGAGARLELQIGAHAFVRADAETQLGLETHEPDFVQLKVTAGRAVVDLRQLERGHTIEVDTPNAALSLDQPGYYRVDVGEERTAFTARRGGHATVTPAGGESTVLTSAQQVIVEGTEAARVTSDSPPEMDAWDRWNYDRTDHILSAASASYLPPDVSGADTLDHYGDWRVAPTYGRVWVPRDVPAAWAPYSTGQWVWDPYYGWTWVDDAPWGWAPYHYGRWVYADDYWAWAPGPIVAAPVYAPALVAFFGVGGVHVGIGLPFVSWVALGWGEPCIPWWGPVGFVGVPWWGGWSGPRFGHFGHHDWGHVTNVTVFRNTHVGHGLVTVHGDHFGHGRIERASFAGVDAHHLQLLHGGPGVKPDPHSLVPRGHSALSRTLRPPDAALARTVVATRAPQSTMARLTAAGLHPTAARPEAPRLVSPGHPQPAAGMGSRVSPTGALSPHSGRAAMPSAPGHGPAAFGGARGDFTARSSRWPAPPPRPHGSIRQSQTFADSGRGGSPGAAATLRRGNPPQGSRHADWGATARLTSPPPPRAQARGGWGWASGANDAGRPSASARQPAAPPSVRPNVDAPRPIARPQVSAPPRRPVGRPEVSAPPPRSVPAPRLSTDSGGRFAPGRMDMPRQHFSAAPRFSGGKSSGGGSRGRGR